MTRLWAGRSRFWFLTEERDISLLRNTLGSHTASYPMSTVDPGCSQYVHHATVHMFQHHYCQNSISKINLYITATLSKYHQQLNTVKYKQAERSTVSANWVRRSISKPSAAQYQQTQCNTISASQTQLSISKWNTGHYQQMDHSTVSANRTQHSISELNTVQYQPSERSTVSANWMQHDISELNTILQYQQTDSKF